MQPQNKRMQAYLKQNGIIATPKYINDGSLKGLWRLYAKDQTWTPELADKLNALGFTNFQGNPFTWLDGNGGMFSTFASGHYELVDNGQVIREYIKVSDRITQIAFLTKH